MCIFFFLSCKFTNKQSLRNAPQLAIQILYIQHEEEFDVFVFAAMFFSILSATISISHQISRKIRDGSKRADNGESVIVGELVKQYSISIQCELLQSYHTNTHRTLVKCICGVLGIDSMGTIEIFYIQKVHGGIFARMEIYSNPNDLRKNMRKQSTLGGTSNQDISNKIQQMGEPNSKLNQLFVQEFCRILNLKATNTTDKVNMVMKMKEIKSTTATRKNNNSTGKKQNTMIGSRTPTVDPNNYGLSSVPAGYTGNGTHIPIGQTSMDSINSFEMGKTAI